MIFDKEGTTTVVCTEKISIENFLKDVEVAYPKFQNDNLILNLSTFEKLSSKDMLEFLQFSNQHKNNGKSFVIVSDKVSYDEVPEEIIVAPTLQEAKDIIEMEEIERELNL